MYMTKQEKKRGGGTVPDNFGTGSGPSATLKHSLHCGLCPIVHLTGHCFGNSILTPVPIKSRNHVQCKQGFSGKNHAADLMREIRQNRQILKDLHLEMLNSHLCNISSERSPELGTGPATWRSRAVALFRSDALPLNSDAWKVINKPCSQRMAN